jgi:hypothetical protein
MSDNLAPSIVVAAAAAVKDKITLQLCEENETLRRALRQARTVSVTGPGGTPLYAVGQFDDGQHAGNPAYWRVSLVDQGVPCPVEDLEHVQVRLGGVCLASFATTNYQGAADYDYNRHDQWTLIDFWFEGTMPLTLQAHVGPFASEETFLYRLPRRSDEMLAHLVTVDATPGIMTAQFTEVQFDANSVGEIIDSLNLDPAVWAEVEFRRGVINGTIPIPHRTTGETAEDDEDEVRGPRRRVPEDRDNEEAADDERVQKRRRVE